MSSICAYRFGTRLTNALNASWGFNLLDDAIADIFVLNTCCHGTSLKNYHGIMLKGPDPDKGGTGGETAFFENAVGGSGLDNCKNHFFVTSPDCPKLIKDITCRQYAVFASVGETAKSFPSNPCLYSIIGVIKGFFSPIVKIRIDPEKFKKVFNVDGTMDFFGLSIAHYTDIFIPANQIGLYGSLTQGLNGKFCERFINDPKKFFGGLAKLILALTILALPIIAGLHCNNTLHWVQLSDYSLNALKIALIAYGAFKGFQVAVRFFAPLA